MLTEAGLTVVEMAAAGPLSTGNVLEKTGENPEASRRWLELELQAARRPELLDAGEHILAAATH